MKTSPLVLKVDNYSPSNKKEILRFLNEIRICEPHDLIECGGVSSYCKNGHLDTQYQFIFSEITNFVLDLFDGNYTASNVWSNICPPGSYVKPHNHYYDEYPNAIAGVYYIQKPKDSGNLIIESEEIIVNENDLIFFEDTKTHWTQPNKSKENRIVISFNLNPKDLNIIE